MPIVSCNFSPIFTLVRTFSHFLDKGDALYPVSFVDQPRSGEVLTLYPWVVRPAFRLASTHFMRRKNVRSISTVCDMNG